MKVVVVGSGFTGVISAAAVKINCPDIEVVLIDSDRVPTNLGFGESAPPQMPMLLHKLLCIKDEDRVKWFTDFITGTKSTIKYNFQWKNFLDAEDNGYFSGIGDMPSYLSIFEPTHTKRFLPQSLAMPDHTEYKLHDLWYELYLQGRRTIQDFEPDINGFYWYSRDHKLVNQVTQANPNQFFTSAPSVHINSYTVATWLKKTYGPLLDSVIPATVESIQADEQGNVTGLMLDNGTEISGDLYLDCTGFKRMFANRFGQTITPVSADITHNAAVIVANGYGADIEKEMHPYTSGFGMDYGWTFSIPLLERKSFGYVYDSTMVSADQAYQELDTLSSPDTRVIDKIELKWVPGMYRKSWNNNYAMIGLSSGFVDAFDANTIGIQFLQLFTLVNALTQNRSDLTKSKVIYNANTQKYFNLISQRVEFHFGLAPRNTSDYWQRNHEIAKEKRLEDKIFEVLDNPAHSLAAHAAWKGQPYMSHLYLTETLYYGIDMSRRCRKSDPAVLDFADEYFKSFNRLNQMRAQLSPTIRDWYMSNGINLSDYITFPEKTS